MMDKEQNGRRIFPGNSGSGLFLMEMIIAVFFVMICVSICILAFAKSERISRTARNRNQAVLAAESTAEIWKAAGADGLEKRMHFTAEQEENMTVMTADYDDFRIRMETVEQENGITDGVITVMLSRPAYGSQDEIFRLETKRYERIN